MDTTGIREESHRLLDLIDERLLIAVHALLRSYSRESPTGGVPQTELEDGVIGYRIGTDEPILVNEADETFEAIVAEVKLGNYVEVDELIAKKSVRW